MKIIGILTATVLTLVAAGCGGNSSTSAQFVASATPASPGLVKLVPRSHSGSRVAIDVLLYGPEPGIDLFTYRFGIKIGDPSFASLVPQMQYTQTALVAEGGQTIVIDVNGDADPSVVQVDIEKQGGGAGNGFTSSSVALIELVFEVQGSGQTTLSLVGIGGNAPVLLDHALAPIGGITFDPESAKLRGVTTGGGGY